MSVIRRSLLSVACLLMTLSVMGRERELSRQESDSVSHALATMWSKSYRNISANDGQSVGAEFMRGIQDALSQSKNEGQTAYIKGWEYGNLMNQGIKDVEKRGGFKVDVARLKNVLKNIEKGRPSGFSDQTAQKYLNWLMKKIDTENYQIDGSEEFLRKASERKGVTTTSSGLIFEVLTEGEGDEMPDANDMVYVRYEGRLIDGKVIGKSDERENAIFSVNELVAGFREGLQMMKIGGKYRLYIPAKLGYGEVGSKNIPGGAATVFDVELLDFRKVDADGNFGDSVLQEKKKNEKK